MPHKEKYPLECKLAICNAILHGTLTISGAARQYHIGYATIRDWLLTYQSDGTGGLVPGRHCKSYSPDLKWSAVQDYLSGKGTATQICTKYRIKSIDRLRAWIKRYNSHDLKLRTPETLMRQGFIRFSDIRQHHIMHTVSGTFPIDPAVLP